MDNDDEYGSQNELKTALDKFAKKIQKKIASNGSESSGCGCSFLNTKRFTMIRHNQNFIIRIVSF